MEGFLPPGYKKYGYADPFEDYVGPFGYKIEDGKIHFAFRAEPHHANTGNTLHGGILMTFADFALCLAATWDQPGEKCVIVDTNNPAELPDGINDADVIEIIDHHILLVFFDLLVSQFHFHSD